MHLTPAAVHNFPKALVVYRTSDPRFLFKNRRGQPQKFWSLVSTIDGGIQPKDCVAQQLC